MAADLDQANLRAQSGNLSGFRNDQGRFQAPVRREFAIEPDINQNASMVNQYDSQNEAGCSDEDHNTFTMKQDTFQLVHNQATFDH
jgi:hypothetical protein